MSTSPLFSGKIIFSALGVLLLWLTIPFPAFAHTSLERAVPGKDAKAQQAVNETRINFNPPSAVPSSFTVNSVNSTVNDTMPVRTVGQTNTSSATDNTDQAVQHPVASRSTDTETTPADNATTDQQPATDDSTSEIPADEKDTEHVSLATWIITIAVVLIAITAAITTLSKRRKH